MWSEKKRVKLDLTHRAAGMVASLVRKDRRKTQKELEASTFVPEEGHMDANAVRLVFLDEILTQLEPQLLNKETQ